MTNVIETTTTDATDDIFIPSNAAAIKRAFAALKKHAVESERTEMADVNAWAKVALPAIEEMTAKGLDTLVDAVRASMFAAAGYTKPDSKEVGYRTIMNRTKRGIQAAKMARKEGYKLDDDGQLVAHANKLRKTVVLKDDDGNVIDKAAPNTLANNPDAEDFLPVPQGAFDTHMVRLGLATAKGTDKRKEETASSATEKAARQFTLAEDFEAFVNRMLGAQGKPVLLAEMTLTEIEIAQQALRLAKHFNGQCNTDERLADVLAALKKEAKAKAPALDAVA